MRKVVKNVKVFSWPSDNRRTNRIQLGRYTIMSINGVGSALYSEALRNLEANRKSDSERKAGNAMEGAATRETGDKVTISSRGNDLGRLVELTKAAPEIDSEKVAQVKSALEDGSLAVDSRELAAKMFKEMSLENWF